MAESCRMINFYYYFKSHNDSRCYIFDDICEVVSNDNHGMNHTTMYYKTYRDSCTDYPHDWVDKIGDNCDIYSTYNWCKGGVVLTNEKEFDALADKRYNLAALDACCECGGGIKIKNGVAFSVDQYWNEPSDILCSFTLHSFEETRSSLRKWDNLVLYELCAYLSEVDCAFLVDSQFDSSDHPYSIHLCSGSEPHTPFPFIIEFLTHDAYVNLLWFSLDASYYSTNINVIYSNYSQCVHHILHDNDINDTSHGIHPCYTEDTVSPTDDPTIDPTIDPTTDPTDDPTTDPTINPTTNPTDDPTINPTSNPTTNPTDDPTVDPTKDPTINPTTNPTVDPTVDPTGNPTTDPTGHPINDPTVDPTTNPRHMVTNWSTRVPRSLAPNAPSNDNPFKFGSDGLLSTFVVMLSVLLVCMGVIIVLLLRKSNKQNANQVDDIVCKPSAPTLAENEYCIICCDNAANMFNDPCGHVTYCDHCADEMGKQDDKCPNCRQIIVQYKQIYHAGFTQN
eukprot:417463_1